MELQSIIIGVLCLAVFIVPIFLLQKRQSGKSLQDYSDMAAKQGLSILKNEFWDPCYALGVDPDKKMLFYTKKHEEGYDQVLIDLSQVEKCTVSNISREVKGDKVIDNVGLLLTYRLGLKLSPTYLEFYNKEETLNLNEELLLAKKWEAIIGSFLAVPSREMALETR